MIVIIIMVFVVFSLLVFSLLKINEKILHEARRREYRSCLEYDLLLEWLDSCLAGRNIIQEYPQLTRKHVAIYGEGNLGYLLYQELKRNNIQVACFIDQRAELLSNAPREIPVITLEKINEFPEIGLIVITPIHAINAISKDINKSIDNKDIVVKGIDEIIFGA